MIDRCRIGGLFEDTRALIVWEPRSLRFYSALFGWKADARQGSEARWVTHVLVPSVTEAERKAIALGASVFAPGGARSPQGVEPYISH